MRFAARGQLTVHDHPGDTDALLTSGLPNGVEPRAEQQLAKHLLYASFWNARTVVFGLKFNDVFLLVNFCDFDADVGEDTGFFTRV